MDIFPKPPAIPQPLDSLNVWPNLVKSKVVPAILAGFDADKPNPGVTNRIYFATDSQMAYRDTGDDWTSLIKSAGKTPVTLVVAAADSKDPSRADYQVPAGSFSAQTIINQAINALPATGGKVVLLEGTYIVNGSIILPSNVHLEILKGATVKLNNNAADQTSIIKNADITNGNSNITISGAGIIDGNKANQTAGNLFNISLYKCSSCLIEGLTIINSKTWAVYLSTSSKNIVRNNFLQNNFYGIYLTNASLNNIIINNISRQNEKGGIYLYSNSDANIVSNNIFEANEDSVFLYNSDYNVIINNLIKDNVYRGIYLMSGSIYNLIKGNIILNNNQAGIEINACHYNAVINNYVMLNKYEGIYLYSCEFCTIIGNYVQANSQYATNYKSNITLTNASSYNNVQGNKCYQGTYTNKPQYGISIATSDCNANLVTNNDLYQGGATGALSDTGTGTVTTAGNRLT